MTKASELLNHIRGGSVRAESAGDEEERGRLAQGIGALMAKIAAMAVVGAVVVGGSVYTVDPTQVAHVTRLGSVVTESPVGPGVHMKIPLIESVDKIAVSLSQLPIKNIQVNTLDNQIITLSINPLYAWSPADSSVRGKCAPRRVGGT